MQYFTIILHILSFNCESRRNGGESYNRIKCVSYKYYSFVHLKKKKDNNLRTSFQYVPSIVVRENAPKF